MEKNKFTVIEKKYLADALSFLGFRYYKYNQENKVVYRFENTEKFNLGLYQLLELRKSLN